MHSDIAMRRLEAIPTVSKTGKRINGLFRLLTCEDLWVRAYSKIATNKGSMTPGSDGETFDGISLEKIASLRSQVLEETYEPKPVRRVYIPKPNGKKRPLGIPSASDRLVQEVVRAVLDAIYEPVFSDQSHGFRAGHSCHTALSYIKDVWAGTKWFVEVDVVGYFDNIDHHVLMSLLEKKIDDKRFLRLINLFLKAGYLENWSYHGTYSGTPQGGIVSPVLANIYLHELDQFMENWMEARNTGNARRVHPVYDSNRNRMNRLRRKRAKLLAAPLPGYLTDATTYDDGLAGLEAEISRLQVANRNLKAMDPFDQTYRRYRYVRYADDFLIGVIGSRVDAEEVMDAVRTFIGTLKLEVSETKSAIRHASDGVIFLGYDVHTWTAKRNCVVNDSRGRSYTKRSPGDRITLNVPAEKALNFCKTKQYGDFSAMKPVHRPAMQQSSEVEIALQYNAEFRGFSEYYALAGNVKSTLNRLEYVAFGSLLRTLANKLRRSTAAIVRQLRRPDGEMYATSQDISGKRRSVRIWRLRYLQEPNAAGPNLDRVNPVRFHLARNDIVHILYANECSNCGFAKLPVEIHHVRKLADHGGSPFMEFIKAARSRKRIPLCKPCHVDLHRGQLADYRNRAKEG